MTIPDPSTDPIQEEVASPHRHRSPYGFLGTLIGLDRLEQRLLDRIDRMLATSASDTAALEAARATLAAADQTIDRIEPAPTTRTKKGTKR